MARDFPHVDGVEHRYVEVNGFRAHYAEAGDPGAPPVVCLHGWPQHWFMWRHVIGPLAETRRVICPDLRGLGWSEVTPGGYEKESLADDLLALLDRLEIDRASLAGHDWGGYAAFLACLREPERFDRYLALNIAPPFSRRSPEVLAASWRLWYQVVLAAPGVGARFAASLADGRARAAFASRNPGVFGEDDLEAFLGQFREPERARATVGYYRSFLTRDLPRVLRGEYREARLEVPTRVVFGAADPVIVPAMLDFDERHAVDYEVEYVPGVGHFIADERPDLVVDRALGWLGSELQVA